MQTTQRLTLEDLGSRASDASAVRWAAAAPGVIAVEFQRESRELVLRYDLDRCTLSDICHHLSRGGISYDTSLLERFRLLNVHRAEHVTRFRTGASVIARCAQQPSLVRTAA